MRSLFALLLAALLVPSLLANNPVTGATGAGSPVAKQDNVRVEIIANTTAVAPGQSFLVGVELTMVPGWHVYAPDPGQIGKPTTIALQLPPGFTSGQARWPQAVSMQQDGFTTNAYEGKLFVVIPVTAPQTVQAGQPLTFTAKLSWLACKDSCVPGGKIVSLSLPSVAQASAAAPANQQRFGGTTNVLDGPLHPRDSSGQSTTSGVSLWWCLLLAFGGGVLLNLMPCVLPVLSIKIMGFVRQAHQQRSVVFKLGLAYTAGTLATFMVLALVVIGLKAAGQTVGWGFQFQHPAFLLVMAAVTTVMGLGMFGLFEVTINAGAQELDTLARKEGPLGAFFLGILATLLSTPCTAPMLGTALGFALSQSAAVILAIFAAIGLGLAAPYLVLSANPGWTRWIPKPGMWMEYFKKAMALIMLASVGWLLWVLKQGFGNQMAIGAVLLCAAVGLGAWFVGRARFKGRSERIWSWATALCLTLSVFLVFVQPVLFSSRAHKAQSSEQLDAETFSPEALNKHLSQGRVVFVDFTAEWCLTCKVNESVVLRSNEVQKEFKDLNVVVLRADWTNGDATITRLLGKFGRSGVPLYVVFSPDRPDQPIVLPEVITRQAVIDALRQAAGKK